MTREYRTTSTRSSLTDSTVLDIRRLSGQVPERQLAEQFDIHRKTIYNIVNNKTWQHVPEPKPIASFRNYSIYPDGRVWSNVSNRFLKPTTRASGESYVKLRNGSKSRTVSVSELVARAFLGTRKRNITVTYRDGNPANSHHQNIQLA